jgi:D-threonate/D-erythronate kinase
MIAVIADDFSGAAELAGLGFTHGLTAQVQTELAADLSAELAVVDTDSRSCSPSEAGLRVAQTVSQLQPSRPELLFKKIDSVVRGPILAELTAIMAVTGHARAILVPGNPSCGRVVRNGNLYVGGQLLHHTEFARDPEYPALTADVLELLGAGGRSDVCLLRPDQRLPARGIILGEADQCDDLMAWAEHIDQSTLPAGAADFFAALLLQRGLHVDHRSRLPNDAAVPPVTLFVSGSTRAWDEPLRKMSSRCGIPATFISPDIVRDHDARRHVPQWTETAVKAIRRRGAAIVTIAQPSRSIQLGSQELVKCLADVVFQVLQERKVDRLFIEGGSTASAVMRRLGWNSFSVVHQYAPGVVALRAETETAIIVTVKPGSYPWPREIWHRLSSVNLYPD